MRSGNLPRPARNRSPSTMVPKKTSSHLWIASLHQALAQTSKSHPRLAVVGVGHELRGDDAAGIAVAKALQSSENERLLVINGGAAPENFTGVLRGFAPDVILIVDAVQMNQPPGTIHLLDNHDIEPCSMTTHTLSHHILASYLEAEMNCVIMLLGIQVEQDLLGAALSPKVRQSIRKIVRVMRVNFMV